MDGTSDADHKKNPKDKGEMRSPIACARKTLNCLLVYTIIVLVVGRRSANAQRQDGVVIIKGHVRMDRNYEPPLQFFAKLACYNPVIIHHHFSFFRGADEIVIMKEEGYFL